MIYEYYGMQITRHAYGKNNGYNMTAMKGIASGKL